MSGKMNPAHMIGFKESMNQLLEETKMLRNPSDMTRVVDLTREKGTGPARTRRPLYVDLLPPCNNACPAGENIQAWLALAQANKFQEAW